MAFKLSIEAAEFVPGPKRNAPPQTDANHGGRSAFSVRPKRETPYPSIGMSHFEHPQTNMNPMGHSWNMSAPEFVPAYICPTLIRGCLPQNQTFGNQSKHHMLQDKQRPRDYMFESKRNEKFANGTASKGPRKNAKKQQKDEPAQPLESRNWRVVSSNNPNNTRSKAHGTNYGTVDKKNVSFSNAALKSENTKAVQATSSSLDYSENFSNMHAKRREIGEGTSMRAEHSQSSPQISSIKSVNKAEESERVGMSWSKIVQSKPTSKQIDTKPSMDNKDRIAVATKTDARRQDGLIQGKNGVRFKDRGDHWSNKVASNVHSDIRGNYAKENHHYRPSEWRGQRRDIKNEGARNQIRNSWGDDLEWRRDSAESKREVTKNRPTSYYDRGKATDRNWKEKKLLWKKTGMVTENYQYKFVTRKFSEEVKEKLLGNTQEFFEHEYNDSPKSHANRTRGWYSMDWGLESQCKRAVDNKFHHDEILDDDKVASTWEACDVSKSAQSLTNRPIITPDKTCIRCGQTKPVPYNMAARQTTKNIEDEKYCSICLKKNSNYLSGNFKITGAEGRSFSNIANDDRRRVQIMNDKSQPAAISVRSNLRTGENGENQETKVRLDEKEILTDELKDLDACKEMHKSDTFANSRHEYLQDLEEDDSDDGWVTVEVKPKRKATREQIVHDNKHKSSPVKQRPSDKVDSSSMIKTTTGSESVGKGAKKKTGVKSSAEDNKQTQEKAKSNAKTKNRKKSSKRKVNTLYENDQKKIKEFKMRQMIEENLKLDLLEMTRTRRPNDAPATTEVEVGKKEEWPAIGNPNISSVNILSFSEALKKKAQPKPAPQVVQPRKAGMLVVDPSKLTPEQKMELKRKKMKEKRKVKKKERKERKRTEKEENTEIDTEKTVFENKSSFKLDLGDMFDMLLKSSAEKSQSSNAQTKSSRHVVFSAGVVSVASGLAKKNKPDGSKHESTRGRLSGNALDFNQHMKMSGKERETPKRKRPTLLKRVILAAREAKRKAREAKMNEDVAASGNKDPVPSTSSQTEEATQGDSELPSKEVLKTEGGAEESYSIKQEEELEAEAVQETKDMAIAAPLTDLPEEIIARLHTRKFREYCDQLLSKDIDQIVYKMLKDLRRFQTRAYIENPIKAKTKKRLVLGIREVARHLKMSRLKCVIIAPNLEKITNEGGIDSYLGKIIFDCKQFSIPVVYSMTRQILGMILKRNVPVSAIGILNYAGVEDDFKQLCALVKEQREKYERRVEELKIEMSQPRSETPGKTSKRSPKQRTYPSVPGQQVYAWNPEVIPFVPQGVMYNYYTSNMIETKFTFNNT
ncbi:uncharacterized protein LOC135692826 [Rhopilema esculentum]|uniref:uncharacterized protein LOC135692826 n=1 Tax=Rhopilema esculentum TaxID=499914 RepID=UPI0031E1D2C7|eukprot:gene2101-17679_t